MVLLSVSAGPDERSLRATVFEPLRVRASGVGLVVAGD
jgi:hypothetical protein